MKKIIRILNLDIHSLNNAEYKNFMERFFKLIPLKAVSGEGDRPSELRLLGEEENMTSDFVGISDEDKATFNADMLLLTDVVNQSRTNDNTALLLNLDKRRDPLVSFIINTTSIGRKSSNPAYAQACISLYNILKPYRGIQNIPMQQETAQIKGMLYDLDKPENKQKITLLHLDDTVSELRNVNDDSTHCPATEPTNGRSMQSGRRRKYATASTRNTTISLPPSLPTALRSRRTRQRFSSRNSTS